MPFSYCLNSQVQELKTYCYDNQNGLNITSQKQFENSMYEKLTLYTQHADLCAEALFSSFFDLLTQLKVLLRNSLDLTA